jgi:hypothetical protein
MFLMNLWMFNLYFVDNWRHHHNVYLDAWRADRENDEYAGEEEDPNQQPLMVVKVVCILFIFTASHYIHIMTKNLSRRCQPIFYWDWPQQ